MPKEKKVLVSSSFLTEFDKLQKKVQKLDELEKHLEEAKEKAEENQGLQNTLSTFQQEYEQMKQQNALEIERRIKASKKVDGFKEKLANAERINTQFKLNTKRLEKAKREVSKNYGLAKKKVDVLAIDIVKKDDDLKRQVEIQKEMAKLMRRRETELERERQERLKDMHTKEIQTRTVLQAVAERDRLANRIKMQDSIANQHTHESYVLVEALRCSKRVSEVYGEDLITREEELVEVKERLARMETMHTDALATIEEEQFRRRDLERQHRRLQSYLMATAKSKSEIMGIMEPSKSRLVDSTISRVERYGGGDRGDRGDRGGDGMVVHGGMSNGMMLENPELGEFDEVEEDEMLVIRRDVEPPLYQAPTFSHLVRSQEQLKIVRRPPMNVMGGSTRGSIGGGGSTLPQSVMSRAGGPTSSVEPLGFGAGGSRWARPIRLEEVSKETLRIVQPPPRMVRAGGSMADTSATGRPLLAPRVGAEAGGAMDTFDVPWFQDAADGIRPPGMLGRSRSVPAVGNGSSVISQKKKVKRYRRRDGNSVTDNDGSLFLGHGLGLKKTRVERTMKGSARHILDNIVARIDFSKIADLD